MAPKSSAPAVPKPAAPAPSDTSSGASSETESSEEPSPPPPNRPPPNSKAPIEEESSDEDSDDGDDVSSDDDAAEPVPPRPSAKPLASPQKPPAAAASSDNKKRKAPEAPPPSPPQNNDTGSEQKRQRFQRLWSKEDEIAILRGMLNHQAKTGALPSKTDMSAFRDSIHNKLTVDVNVTQLSEKVRRLKSKYAKNPSASPAKPHDSAVHELSHKIWGASKALDGSGAVDAAEAADGSTTRKLGTVNKEEGNAAAGKLGKVNKEEGNAVMGKIGKVNKEEENAAAGKIGKVNKEEGNSAAGKIGKVNKEEGIAVYSAEAKPRFTYLKHALTRMGDCLPSGVTMEEVLDFVDNSKAMEIEEKLKKLWILRLKDQVREMESKIEVTKMVMKALDNMG